MMKLPLLSFFASMLGAVVSTFSVQAWSANLSDHPCYDKIISQMKSKNVFKNGSLNKSFSTAEEYVSGRSEFDIFDGSTRVRVGYGKREDGSDGAKLVFGRYDLLDDSQELIFTYSAKCEIDHVTYNGTSVNKKQCEELRGVDSNSAASSSKLKTVLKPSATKDTYSCVDIVQLQKACRALTGVNLNNANFAPPPAAPASAVK